MSTDMDAMPLHFKRHDLVEVRGDRGYVNCICIATPNHLHKHTPTSYFTLTIEGTHNTDRPVNVCVYRPHWSQVKLIKSYVEPSKQNNHSSTWTGIDRSHEDHAEETLVEL